MGMVTVVEANAAFALGARGRAVLRSCAPRHVHAMTRLKFAPAVGRAAAPVIVAAVRGVGVFWRLRGAGAVMCVHTCRRIWLEQTSTPKTYQVF